MADSTAKGSRQPSSTKSMRRPVLFSNSPIICEIVSKDIRAFLSYSTSISTSLSAVCSPLAKEPKSQAFRTGYVLKYSAICSVIACVLIIARIYSFCGQIYELFLKHPKLLPFFMDYRLEKKGVKVPGPIVPSCASLLFGYNFSSMSNSKEIVSLNSSMACGREEHVKREIIATKFICPSILPSAV